MSSTNSVIPSTAFNGVRISWLMFAKKVLFAWLAASAASFAFRSSSWACLRSVMSWLMPNVPTSLPSLSRSGIFVVRAHRTRPSMCVSFSSWLTRPSPERMIRCSSR